MEKTPALIRRAGSRSELDDKRALAVVVVASADAAALNRTQTFMHALTVGRSAEPDVQLVIDDRSLSRRHVTFAAAGPGLVEVTDLGSTNGTTVRGSRIEKETVKLGEPVRVGETVLVVDEISLQKEEGSAGELIGDSLAMRRLRSDIDRVASTELPVLVLGETGTGKELIARRIHEASRHSGRFVAVNCGAIPHTLAESTFFGHKKGAFTGATTDSRGVWLDAQDGTLFLDEIGELPLDIQPKILRVLDNCELTAVGDNVVRKSNARIVAATNVNLAQRVEEGLFRRDLYARLAVYVLNPPPLRERRIDIVRLFRVWLERAGCKVEIDAEAAVKLVSYEWPMNVRELKNLAQRLAVAKPTAITADLLPDNMQAQRELASTLELSTSPRPEELQRLLDKHEGNIAAVATELKKDRKQVYRWLKRFGLRD